jgi:hypothetical protein
LSYSGSILFCELIRQTKRGELVGESPGGFVNVRGGMRAPVKVPNIKYEYMKVPYSVSSCFSDFESGNDYVKLDYEIEPSLDEWLDNNDGVLMRLIRKIKLCRND